MLPPQPIPRKASRLRSTEISPMPQLDAQLSTDDEGLPQSTEAMCHTHMAAPACHGSCPIVSSSSSSSLIAAMAFSCAGEGTFADWLPQPVADWAHWAYENPSTLVYYGFGAATVGATLVLLMGGRRRR